MAKDKAPAFQFYPKDLLTDEKVVRMSNTELGVYIRLLCFCWLEGSLPLETEALACMARMPVKQFTKFWENTVVRTCFFVSDDGRLCHKRLDEEREKQRTFKRRQSDNGVKGAEKRWGKDGGAIAVPSSNDSHRNGGAIVSPMAIDSSSSPISNLHLQEREKASLSDASRDPFTDRDVTERAGRFVERYQGLYQKHRHGARYALKPTRDYAAAVTLCDTWPDDRLDKLAVIFLTTDHKFAAEGSRTIPQFLALASWCDGKLAEYERGKTA